MVLEESYLWVKPRGFESHSRQHLFVFLFLHPRRYVGWSAVVLEDGNGSFRQSWSQDLGKIGSAHVERDKAEREREGVPDCNLQYNTWNLSHCRTQEAHETEGQD